MPLLISTLHLRGQYAGANQGVTPPVLQITRTQREWRNSPVTSVRGAPVPSGPSFFFMASFLRCPNLLARPRWCRFRWARPPSSPPPFFFWVSRDARRGGPTRAPSLYFENCADPPVAPKNPSLLVPHPGRCHLPVTDLERRPSLLILFAFKSTSR